MTANDLLERIAPNEAVFTDSLFKPVQFSDGTSGTYSGFVRAKPGKRVDFFLFGHEYTITGRSVWACRSVHEGKNWFSYTLDPTNGQLTFSQEAEFSQLMLSKFKGKK